MKNDVTIFKQLNLSRNSYFLAFNALLVLAFFGPLRDIVLTSYRSDTFSYIPFIPFISAYLIFLKRQTIFSEKRSFSVTGLILVIVGIVLLSNICEFITSGDDNGFVSHLAFSMVLIWIGGFALCYGTGALRAAAFSLLFLFFMVPIPDFALDKIVSLLQNGSTLAAYGFFKLSGVPMVREGYVFHLPTINIIVARECSGIRSALSLVITGLVAGHLFLRTGWSKFILVLFIVPLAIIKNGFRIAVLSLLGVYVDERILGSELHRNGGILFFILSLVLLWGIIALLKKAEGRLQHENEPTLLAEKAHKP